MIPKNKWREHCNDSGLNHYELYYIYNQWCQRLDAKFAAFLRLAKEPEKCMWEVESYRGFNYSINPQQWRYWFDPVNGILAKAGLLAKVLEKSKAKEKNASVGALGRHSRVIAVGGYKFADGPLRYEQAVGSRALDSSYLMSPEVHSLLRIHKQAWQSRTKYEVYGNNRKPAGMLLDAHRGILGDKNSILLQREDVEKGSNTLGFCLLPDVASVGIDMVSLALQRRGVGLSLDIIGENTLKFVSGGGDPENTDDSILVTGTNVTSYKFNENYINTVGPTFILKKIIEPEEPKINGVKGMRKFKSECYDNIAGGLMPWHHGFVHQLPSVYNYAGPVVHVDGCNIKMDVNLNQLGPMQYKDNIDKCKISHLNDLALGAGISKAHYASSKTLMRDITQAECEKK